MKGLILKEFYSVRFQLIMCLLLFMLPNFFLILIGITYDPAGENVFDGELLTALAAMMSFISIVCCSSFMVNNISEDVSCGWIKLTGTMPVSARKISAAKIISAMLLIAGLTAISLAVNLIAASGKGCNTEIMIAAPICSGLFQIGVLAPVFPAALKFGSRTVTPLYFGFLLLFAAVIGIACVIMLKIGSIAYISWGFYGSVASCVRWVFYGLIPLVTAVSVALSLTISTNRLSYM